MSVGKELNNRLEQLIKERGINTAQLHKHTGIPLSTLKRLRLNKENNPTLASLIPLANYFSITIDQLIGIEPLYINTPPTGITVPIIHWKNALKSKEDKLKQAFSVLLVVGSNLSEDSYALIIKKSEWINFLKNSLLIIDPALEPNNRDFIIAYRGERHLPQLNQVIISENKRYLKLSDLEPKIIPFEDNCKCLGVVTQIKMNYKQNKAHVDFKDKKTSLISKKY